MCNVHNFLWSKFIVIYSACIDSVIGQPNPMLALSYIDWGGGGGGGGGLPPWSETQYRIQSTWRCLAMQEH